MRRDSGHPIPKQIVLVGLMGAGKTSVGKLLAQQLHRDYWDSDQALRSEGNTASSIAEQSGPGELHRREFENLVIAMERAPGAIFGAAASVVLSDEASRQVSHAWVVWLRVGVATVVKRIEESPGDRPFIGGDIISLIGEMARIRNPLYEALADQVIDVDGRTSASIASEIVSRLPAPKLGER